MFEYDLGIIGVGNIGSTLIQLIMKNKIIDTKKLIVYDKNKDILKNLNDDYNLKFAKSNRDLVSKSKYVLLSIKPQIIDIVLHEISSTITSNQILVSIAAGITLDHLKRVINGNIPIIRIMTNIALLVGEGASAIAYNDKVIEENVAFIKKIFNSGGLIIDVEEEHIDAVTGLSGNGPAFVFMIIDALGDGGVKMGLPKKIAINLAAQTVLGSAKLLLETNKHPGELKDMVSSPGGTTIHALHVLEETKLRATLIKAVEIGTEKSKSLNNTYIHKYKNRLKSK